MYGGFFISKPVKLNKGAEIIGFDFSGTGELSVMFNKGGVWGKLSEQGIFTQVPNQSPDLPSVIDLGNSLDELHSIPSYNDLTGTIQLAVVLGADDKPPVAKFAVRIQEEGVETVKVIESEEFSVRGNIQSIKGDCSENVVLSVSGYKNGRWLPYVLIDQAGADYEKVKFKAVMTLDELGQTAEFHGVTLKAQPKDIVIPSDEVSIYTKKPLKDAKVYVVGNNKGIVKAFCSNTTPAQWREIERLTENSFDGANGMLKLTLTKDGEETPEIEGLVIQE